MGKMYRLRIIICGLCFLSKILFIGASRKCIFDNVIDSVCTESEVCDASGTCQCLPGHVRLNDTHCTKTSTSTPNYSSLVDNKGNGSVVAGVLIPLFLIAFVICGVYVSRKYKIVYWFRQKFHRRHENYDEFMIGQDDDDPPLA